MKDLKVVQYNSSHYQS